MASEADYEQMLADFRSGGFGYGDFKKRLLAATRDYFAPMREKRAELEADPDHVENVLADGARRANEIATGVLDRVKIACGLR